MEQTNPYQVRIFNIEAATFFGLGVWTVCRLSSVETIFEIESLESFDGILHVVLPFGIFLSGLIADSLNILGCDCVVGPSQQQFILLVLNLVLSSLVKVSEMSLANSRLRSILDGFEYRLVEIVTHKVNRLWGRHGSDLAEKLVSILALLFGIIQHDTVWLEVEDALIAFVC